MSVLSYLIDALRRIGSSSDKSALRRQDKQLEGRTVLERRLHVARLGEEVSSGFHATVEAIPEKISAPSIEVLSSIRSNAAMAESVFEAFDIPATMPTLDRLDCAFALWLAGPDRQGYSEREIAEILGAHFGEYCNAQLGMAWVHVTDQYGECLAIEGRDHCVRGFPYHSIEKRIADDEHTFFRGIFVHLAEQKAGAMRLDDGA